MKILVICEDIYCKINSKEKTGGPNGALYKHVKKNKNEWFYIGGEENIPQSGMEILKWAKSKGINRIYVHKTQQNVDEILEDIRQQLRRDFESIEIIGFHTTDKELYDALINADLSKAEEVIKKKQAIPHFSTLKHKIMHIFLPLDIDFQGISKVYTQEGSQKAVDHLKDMLRSVLSSKNEPSFPKDKDNKPAYYRQKLADLWYAVVKKEFSDIVSPSENIKKLIGNNAAIDLIPKEKMIDQKVNSTWKKLLETCGLKYNDSNQFNDKKVKPDTDSDIFEFVCQLDDLLAKNNVDKNDVDGILKFKFHNWYNKLGECLDELREKLSG